MSDMEGVRLTEPNTDRIDWCRRTGVPVPFKVVMVDVTLRRVADGVERVIVDETGFCLDEGENLDDLLYGGISYQWKLGNYGCDCNRRLMFQRAGDEDETDHECGHGAFVIAAPEWLTGEER